jgi:hypothetical protein
MAEPNPQTLVQRFVVAFRRDWLDREAPISLAMTRVGIGLAALLANRWYFQHIDVGWFTPDSYDPDGLAALMHSQIPTTEMVSVWVAVGLVSTVLAMAGVFSRVTMMISCLSGLVLAGLYEGATEHWSHGFNTLLIAQMAFVAAPPARVLAVDAWLQRRGWRVDPVIPSGEQPSASFWPVFLAQWAVAIVFLNAAYWKLRRGGIGFRWVFSDNMRNILLQQYDAMGLAMPVYLQWVADHAWAYQSLAAINIFTQMAPAAACIWAHRPILRAVLGSAFVLELIGLGVVMHLWDFHLMPLAVLFIDWDALWRWLRRGNEATAVGTSMSRGGWPVRAAVAWIVLLLGVQVFIAFFSPRALPSRLNTYPFSKWSMYSALKVRKPYGEHQPYHLRGASFEVWVEGEHRLDLEQGLQSRFYNAGDSTNVDAIKSLVARMAHHIDKANLQDKSYRIVAFRTEYRSDAYPAPADLKIADRGAIVVFESGHEPKWVFAKVVLGDPQPSLRLTQRGFTDPVFDLSCVVDRSGIEQAVKGHWEDGLFVMTPPLGEVLFIVRVRDRLEPPEKAIRFFCDGHRFK